LGLGGGLSRDGSLAHPRKIHSYRVSTHCGPWFFTLLIEVLIGRAVIRSESNGTSTQLRNIGS
jgi:hypothetical protein